MVRTTRRDGTVVEWSGLGVCYCTACEVLFGSPTAFDAHIRRSRKGEKPKHDYESMPVNARGHRVTSLREM